MKCYKKDSYGNWVETDKDTLDNGEKFRIEINTVAGLAFVEGVQDKPDELVVQDKHDESTA